MTDETALTTFARPLDIPGFLQEGLVPALGKAIQFTPKGLELLGDLTFEQAQGVTHYIAEVIKRDVLEVNLLQLCLGQIINHAEARWGDRYSQWLDETGLAYGTLANAAYVARKVANWNDRLAFSHHTVVAPLPPDEQVHWLDVAEDEELGANELRRRIQADRDIKAGRDPDRADIERQLQRIARKMAELDDEAWAATIIDGLIKPLAHNCARHRVWAVLTQLDSEITIAIDTIYCKRLNEARNARATRKAIGSACSKVGMP